MVRSIFLVLLLVTLGCKGEGREVPAEGGYAVQELFTVDGCTVYRFSDFGTYYFTNCKGSVQWDEHCGKNCTRRQSIPTE